MKKVWSFLSLLSVALIQTQWGWAIPVDPDLLEREIGLRRTLVPDFNQIAIEARQRGLRVYLAGGLAASYGDFVKHQVLSDQGKETIQAGRLANTTSNIVLPAQDLDLVVTRAGGATESAQDLRDFKSWLDSNIPHTLDGISKWDVIGLKTTVGKHLAVEGNPEFSAQNNDSLSIGMIELTTPSNGESVIREAQHVAKPSGFSIFLKDLASDSISFLQSPMHHQTSKAMAGGNPEILGAIRVLIKAFQFNRELPKDQMEKISEIIRSFDPKSIPEGTYAYNWIQHRARRLLVHAYDPEAAIKKLDELGLRQKLIVMGGDPDRVESLAWWLKKQPLSISPSSGASRTGKTAAELGIKNVAHDTNENVHRLVTWRYDGLPRALISRANFKGEVAAYGDGFYTAVGTSVRDVYARASAGHTLVFDVNPSALEGRDFKFLAPDLAIWLNGANLKVRQDKSEYSRASCVISQLNNLGASAGRTNLGPHVVHLGTFVTPASGGPPVQVHVQGQVQVQGSAPAGMFSSPQDKRKTLLIGGGGTLAAWALGDKLFKALDDKANHPPAQSDTATQAAPESSASPEPSSSSSPN